MTMLSSPPRAVTHYLSKLFFLSAHFCIFTDSKQGEHIHMFQKVCSCLHILSMFICCLRHYLRLTGVGVGTEIGGEKYNFERKCMFFHSQHFTHFLPVSLLCLSISRNRHTEQFDLPHGRHSSLGLCLNLSVLPSASLKKHTYFTLKEA